MTIFSFSDYEAESEDELPFDDYLTVRAFLEAHFGKHTGGEVYKQLLRMAKKSADDVGGLPGIVFNDDGGEFVSFRDDSNSETFGAFSGDDEDDVIS
jgi:hypothetical protein